MAKGQAEIIGTFHIRRWGLVASQMAIFLKFFFSSNLQLALVWILNIILVYYLEQDTLKSCSCFGSGFSQMWCCRGWTTSLCCIGMAYITSGLLGLLYWGYGKHFSWVCSQNTLKIHLSHPYFRVWWLPNWCWWNGLVHFWKPCSLS